MVLCVVVGCSKHSVRDNNISLHKIPVVNDKKARILAAISSKDIDVNELCKYRICSRHSFSGQPAAFYDQSNPDWLLSLNFGYDRIAASKLSIPKERWERACERDHRRMVLQEIKESYQV